LEDESPNCLNSSASAVVEGYSENNKSLKALIIHELTHMWHARWGVWQESFSNTFTGKGLPQEEIETTYTENLVRVQLGLPRLVSYVGSKCIAYPEGHTYSLYNVDGKGNIKGNPIYKPKLKYEWGNPQNRVHR
jgi:hypothetical protein